MQQTRPVIDVIGVPSDLGANVRGANIGPSAIRIAGLSERIESLGYKVQDTGDIAVPVRETLKTQTHLVKYREEIIAICSATRDRVLNALTQGHIPIVLGGDHSIAMGSIGAVHQHFTAQKKQFGLIWVDAHADLNTPDSTESGNVHGMPLAALLGMGDPELTALGGPGPKVHAANVALVGIRNLDNKEKEMLKKVGIRYFTMREIDERGMFAVMKDAIQIARDGTHGIHLSFDLDGVDPLYAPGVSTPVPGGLDYREAHLALEMIADERMLCSMDFVELNPMKDDNHKTAGLTVELIQSALGKSIV